MVVPDPVVMVRATVDEQVQNRDAYLAAFRRALTLQAGELAGELAGDDQLGEGYLARAGRLIAAGTRPKNSSGISTGRFRQMTRTPPRNARSSSGGTIPHGRRWIPNGANG